MAEPDQNRLTPTAVSADGTSSSPSKASSSEKSSAPPPAAPEPSQSTADAPTTSSSAGGGGEANNDDDMLLVTEFPPPPYYYTLASRQTPSHLKLTPPDIPHRAFRVAAKRVMAERQKAREESERIRLEAEKELGVVGGDGGSSGAASGAGSGGDTKLMDVDKNESTSSEEPTTKIDSPTNKSTTTLKQSSSDDDDDSIDPNDPNETVVAVFGEIVEDPTLVVEEECHDPVEIRENVKRLNRAVLNGFLKLVQTLVNDPHENKKLRDELSHNLFLMLQECNKFREHQAREILINTLEQQLESRRRGVEVLRERIVEAEEALGALAKFKIEQGSTP